MTDQDKLFDLVDRYLDDEMDQTAWDQAVAEHGAALQQALEQERAVRTSIKQIPRTALPPGLAEQLKNIPKKHSAADNKAQVAAKRPLLFPVINTIAALAACIVITLTAIYTTTAINDDADNNLALHDDQVPAMRAPLESQRQRKSEKDSAAAIENAEGKELQKSEVWQLHNEPTGDGAGAPAGGNAIITAIDEPVAEELAEAAPDTTDPAADRGIAADKDRRQQEQAATLDDMRADAPAIVAGADHATSSPESPDMVQSSRSMKTKKQADLPRQELKKSDFAAAETSVTANAEADDSLAEKESAPAAKQLRGAQEMDGKPAALTDSDMEAALAEARSNLANNEKLKGAVAERQTKNREKNQREIIRQLAETQNNFFGKDNKDLQIQKAEAPLTGEGGDNAAAAVAAPALGLGLAASHQQDYLRLGISMNDVEHEWFRKAILDMKIRAYDNDGKVVWESPVTTKQLTEDVIELRSNGMPPATAKTLKLESLGQQSAAIDVPAP